MKTSILLVTDGIWSLAVFRKNLIRELVERGYDIKILVVYGSGSYFDGLEVKGLGQDKRVGGVVRAFLSAVYLRWAGFTHKCDVILTFTLPGHLIGAVLKKKSQVYIPTIAGLGSFAQHIAHGRTLKAPFRGALAFFCYQLICRMANVVLVQNFMDRDRLVEIQCAPLKKFEKVYGSGVNLFTCNNTARPNGFYVIGMITRLIKPKRVDLFCQVARSLKLDPRFKFVLFGKFDLGHPQAIYQNELANMLDGSGIDFRGETSAPQDEMFGLHVLMVPSEYAEGLPYSILEARAAGCLIVGNGANSGVAQATGVKGGYLVESNNVETYKEVLEAYAAQSPQRKLEMVSASLSEMERYSVKNVAMSYVTAMARCEMVL